VSTSSIFQLMQTEFNARSIACVIATVTQDASSVVALLSSGVAFS
jgi:hypothetical protein